MDLLLPVKMSLLQGRGDNQKPPQEFNALTKLNSCGGFFYTYLLTMLTFRLYGSCSCGGKSFELWSNLCHNDNLDEIKSDKWYKAG